MTRRLTDAEFAEAMDDLIVEDILAMTGDELRAEIIAEGGDPDAIEAECRAALERAIRECEAARGAGNVKPSAGLPAVAASGERDDDEVRPVPAPGRRCRHTPLR